MYHPCFYEIFTTVCVLSTPVGAYHQDILDALKERAQTGATYRCIDANRYDSLPPAPPPPPPVVPINQQQRFHAPQQAEGNVCVYILLPCVTPVAYAT